MQQTYCKYSIRALSPSKAQMLGFCSYESRLDLGALHKNTSMGLRIMMGIRAQNKVAAFSSQPLECGACIVGSMPSKGTAGRSMLSARMMRLQFSCSSELYPYLPINGPVFTSTGYLENTSQNDVGNHSGLKYRPENPMWLLSGQCIRIPK